MKADSQGCVKHSQLHHKYLKVIKLSVTLAGMDGNSIKIDTKIKRWKLVYPSEWKLINSFSKEHKRQFTRKPGNLRGRCKVHFVTWLSVNPDCFSKKVNLQFSWKFWKSEMDCFHWLPGFLLHCLIRLEMVSLDLCIESPSSFSSCEYRCLTMA